MLASDSRIIRVNEVESVGYERLVASDEAGHQGLDAAIEVL